MTTRTIVACLHVSVLFVYAGLSFVAHGYRARAQDLSQLIRTSKAEAILAQHEHSVSKEARALQAIGNSYRLMGRPKLALQFLEKALTKRISLKDLRGQAETLTSLSEVYNDIGEPRRAVYLLNRALALEIKVADRGKQAKTLTDLGNVDRGLGKFKEALASLNEALTLEQANRDRFHEAESLNFIGEVYADQGDGDKSMTFYQQALPLAREMGQRREEASVLIDMGSYYSAINKPENAIGLYRQALPIVIAIGDRTDQAITLHCIGNVYEATGEAKKALDAYNQALIIEKLTDNIGSQGNTLWAIGIVYEDIGQPQTAIATLTKALVIERAVGNLQGEGITLNNMAGAYSDLGQQEKAIELFRNALQIDRKIGDKASETIALHNIGALYQESGEPDLARRFFAEALTLEKSGGAHLAEAYTLWRSALLDPSSPVSLYLAPLRVAQDSGDLQLQGMIDDSLMRLFSRRNRPNVAIFFGKEAVNDYQRIRGNIGGIESQTIFAESKGDTYRRLAKLLIDQGRIAEAELVVRMLKREEYTQFLRGGSTVEASETVALNGPEAKAESITAEELSWLAKQAQFDQMEQGPAKSALGQEVAGLTDQLTKSNETFETLIERTLSDERDQRDQAAETTQMQNILQDLRAQSPHTVGVYSLVLDTEIVLVVITENLKVPPHVVTIARKDLNSKIEKLRDDIQDPCSDPREAAADLYNILIEPIINDLRGAQATTIVWELDRGLRYLPIGALYNGHSYISQDYKNVLFTTAHTEALIPSVKPNTSQALGLGVAHTTPPSLDLPEVPKELEAIIHDRDDPNSKGPLEGKILLDSDFTPSAMQSAFKSRFAIVHIASHFFLNPGSYNSYLLLGAPDPGKPGSERLDYSELMTNPLYSLKGVHLLTLSACETGTSGGQRDADGKEIDALGEAAEGRGAQSVLATLWRVNDASTSEFMASFYKHWTSDSPLKVEALRQAQLDMLRGGDLDTTHKTCTQTGQLPHLSHPYYWAPFVLIGNWQ